MSKILLISHIFPPAIDGGSRVVYKLGQQLKSRGHQTLYLSSDCSSTDNFVKKQTIRPKTPLNHPPNILKIPVYHSFRRPLKFLSLFIPKKSNFYQLLKILQKGPLFKFIPFTKSVIKILKFEPEIIIAGPLPTSIVLYAHFIKKIINLKYTFFIFKKDSNLSPKKDCKILINSSFHPTNTDFHQQPLINALQHADYLWTLTQFETNYFIKNFQINPKKIILAGNGVDSKFIKSNTITSKVFNILFIGSLSAHKRVDLLVKSFSLLLKNKINLPVKLTIAGQKTLFYPQIEQVIKLLPKNVKQQIKFIFNFPQKKLANLIDNCTCLVLPSIEESFGLVIIESWSRCKPVIVSNIPSLSEIVNQAKGGLTFKKDNQTDLAKKIKQLIDSPKNCQQYGQNGFNHVKTNYTWEKVTQKICQKLSLS